MFAGTAGAQGSPAQRGFTLIELMIVVAVIAVLTVIAIASYDWATTKTRRKEAASCIEQGAQYMERFHATNLRYDKTIAGVAVALPNQCPADLATYYTVSVSAVAATTYTLQAVPIGTQATRDTACGTLSMNQTGTKAASGGGSECW